MEFIFKIRRDYSWRWAQQNPILAEGEPGFERDTGKLKVGNGINPWNDLKYFIPRNPNETPTDNLIDHVEAPLPHPVYDDGPSLTLLYENAKV
jgi:hypothetical protein